MIQRLHDKPLISNSTESKNAEAHYLVLYNDDFNTFEFVIESLIEVCEHSAEQAEQCATITHYKGKCEIKKGLKTELQPMQIALIKRNLKALIE
jgi:ATP-dependent Clp protease adaptor protein ClpS